MKKMLAGLIGLMLVLCSTSAFAQDIGVVWSGKSGMTKRVMAGFEQGMKELAPGVKIEVQAELESIDDLAVVAARFRQISASLRLGQVEGL